MVGQEENVELTQITLNSRRFRIKGRVEKRRINDWAEPIPGSGKQDPNTRFARQSLRLGPIYNAFAGITHLSTAQERADFERGEMHTLFFSNCETRFGHITKGRLVNASSDNGATDMLFGDAYLATPVVIFQGEAFCMAETPVSTYRVSIFKYTGGTWVSQTAAADSGITRPRDMTKHKDNMLLLVDEYPDLGLYDSPDGITWTTTQATGFTQGKDEPGSKVYSTGDTILVWHQNGVTDWQLQKSTNDGANFGDVVAGNGLVRAVTSFFDHGGTPRVVFATTDTLYYTDETGVFVLDAMPFPVRALVSVGSELFIFFDGGRVWRYAVGGGAIDISPGGGEKMKSGYQFNEDSDGQVQVWKDATGIYAGWSGSGLSPLILFWSFVTNGWHFIGRDAEVGANVTNDFRYIVRDPVSDDLVWGVADPGNTDDTDHHRQKDISKNPKTLTTPDFDTAENTIETKRSSLGSPAVSTTFWDVFLESDDVDASETVILSYGVDGAAHDANALPAWDADPSDNTFQKYPGALSTDDGGVNFTSIQQEVALVNDGVTVSPDIIQIEFGYQKMPDPRWVYIVTILTDDAWENNEAEETARAALETIEKLKVKTTLSYGNSGDLSVIPIPQSRAVELIGGEAEEPLIHSTERTLYLAEL